MSKKSSLSSSSPDQSSRKWRTEFKELDSPRSLPTYYGDEELQPHHPAPLSSSLGDEPNFLKELKPLGGSCGSVGSVRSGGSSDMMVGSRGGGSSEVMVGSPGHPLAGGTRAGQQGDVVELEGEVDVSSLPLDVDSPGIHRYMLEEEHEVPSKESIEKSLNSANTDVVPEKSKDVSTERLNDETDDVAQKCPTNVPISSEFLDAASSISPVSSDLSLGKIEGKEEVTADVMEDSLDLFQDVRKKNPRPAPPPRPPKPKVSVSATEHHPLMSIIDPDPSDFNFDDVLNSYNQEAKTSSGAPRTGLTAKISMNFKKRSRSPKGTENNSPTPPAPGNDDQEGGLIPPPDSISMTSTESTPSRKQKFKAMRNQLAAKAYSKYSQYYDYYYNKNKNLKEEADEAAERGRTSSENSEGSFCEITAEEVKEVPKVTSGDSDAEQSATEFVEEELQAVTANVTPNNELETVDPSQSPDMSASPHSDLPIPSSSIPSQNTTNFPSFIPRLNQLISFSYQRHILFSSIVCVFSVLLYLIAFHFNSFLQGFCLGGFLPAVLGILFLAFTRASPDDENKSGTRTAQQVDRLRKLGSSSSLKDFFQYTEAHNFGELRTKSMPYRYFKLKGSIIEASELSATKEQVPDPLKLTRAEIKSYGLKPIFKADISGWLVTIEAPPGTTITPSNMWRKRYPIWVRKRSWRTEVDEYDAEYTVNSFYLISPYSRYKEHWFEALRRAANTSDLEDVGDLQKGTYRDFMERLFDVIPSLRDKDKGDKVNEPQTNPQNTTSPTRSHDMQHSAWVNALFGRFVWNILHDKKWENRIRERIVKKLSAVNTRHISSVELKSFDLGNSVPLITNTYLPNIDHQGVWSEMDLEWSGEVSLTLAARINSKSSTQTDNSKTFEPMKLESDKGTEPAPPTGKLAKLYRLIEKIEIGVSAKVTRVAGRLCVNIPPPPTDCIWYGFTKPPELKIHLTPILGRWISLDYRPITNALEKQLQSVFNDTFVLPAMENVVMPGMSRNLEMKTENPLPETLDMSQLLDPVSGESELLDVAISPAGPSRTGSFRGSQGSLRNSPVL
ncbi:hypothetical protein ACHWQZ_G013804 [Mnemiopsis leidyi]